MLVLDAGNALIADQEPAKKTEGQSSVQVLNMLSYQVVTLGLRDLNISVSALEQRMQEANFTFVSANVVVSATGELLAEPYVIQEIDGHRVAIIGITNQGRRQEVRVENPLETAQKIVPEVAAQADIVIILTQVGFERAQEIANQVPNIDLIIDGGSKGQVGLWYSKTKVPIICADKSSQGHAGRNVGLAHLAFDAGGRLENITWESTALTVENAPDDPDVLKWSQSQPRR